MNKIMINIAEILKDCPEGTELYSPIFGECTLKQVFKSNIYVLIKCNNDVALFNKYGQYDEYMEECLLFPSKDNRDWNKYQAPYDFKPYNFKPFDKVVVRDGLDWHIDFFEQYLPSENFPYECANNQWRQCLPYNEETVKLIGTTDDYNG